MSSYPPRTHSESVVTTSCNKKKEFNFVESHGPKIQVIEVYVYNNGRKKVSDADVVTVYRYC